LLMAPKTNPFTVHSAQSPSKERAARMSRVKDFEWEPLDLASPLLDPLIAGTSVASEWGAGSGWLMTSVVFLVRLAASPSWIGHYLTAGPLGAGNLPLSSRSHGDLHPESIGIIETHWGVRLWIHHSVRLVLSQPEPDFFESLLSGKPTPGAAYCPCFAITGARPR